MRLIAAVGSLLLALGYQCGSPLRAEEAGAPRAAPPSAVEDIYVLRSVREARGNPSEACLPARSKLQDPAWEDQYTFRAVATDPTSGRITEAEAASVGKIRACFGRTADAAIMELYGDFEIDGIAGKAFGKCHMTRSDFPEKGVRLFGCIFDLFDLPKGYVGGQLTTNSATSGKLFGTQSDPEGYTQVSIATIRLWRPREPQ